MARSSGRSLLGLSLCLALAAGAAFLAPVQRATATSPSPGSFEKKTTWRLSAPAARESSSRSLAPLALLALAWAARSATRPGPKPTARKAVVTLAAPQTVTLPTAPTPRAAPETSEGWSPDAELIDLSPVASPTVAELPEDLAGIFCAAPALAAKARPQRHTKRRAGTPRSTRSARRAIGARLMAKIPAEPVKRSFDISKVRLKLQHAIRGTGSARTVGRGREPHFTESGATGQGIVMKSVYRVFIRSSLLHRHEDDYGLAGQTASGTSALSWGSGILQLGSRIGAPPGPRSMAEYGADARLAEDADPREGSR